MSAVFKKEFSQLFHSMIGYVCLAVFAAITGYYFFTLNLLAASGDVRGYFSSVANVIMLILPMLTMRRKRKCAPISCSLLPPFLLSPSSWGKR